jgi:hypothetical protein
MLAAPALAGWECENQGVWPITLNVCFGGRKAQVFLYPSEQAGRLTDEKN